MMNNEKTKSASGWASKLVSVLFVLILLLSGIFTFLFQRDMSETENRSLEQLPKPKLSDIASGAWQSRFEEFSSDQFPLRDGLNSLGATVKYALGERMLGGALVGHTKDDDIRLFEMPKYDTERADRLAETLDAIDAFAGTVDVPVRLLAAPPSALIYEDELPAFADISELRALYDAVSADGKNYGAIPVLSAILSARDGDGDSLYFRTDHHWTARGAFAAYREFCSDAGKTFVASGFEEAGGGFLGTLYSKVLLPQIKPDTVEKSALDVSGVTVRVGSGVNVDKTMTEAELYRPDKLTVKDKYQYFMGGNYGLAEIVNDALPDNAPSILIFKDSYADVFVPYLTSHYKKIVMIDARFYRGASADLKALIESTAPEEILFLYETVTLSDDTSLSPLLSRVSASEKG